MYVFPDNIKTWIIGDGYFANPGDTDPYYVGPLGGAFYKSTDVGYLRFIFYFGVIGLFAFILYFFKCAQVCVSRFKREALMFWLILLVNYILWFKVATDIFIVFALFLCVVSDDTQDAYIDVTRDI